MAREEQHHGVINTLFTIVFTIITSITLIFGLFGTGFLLCTTPVATSAIGHAFGEWDSKIYPETDMEALAEAVRSFSIEGTGRDDLLETVKGVIEKSHPELAVSVENGELSITYSGTIKGLNESLQYLAQTTGDGNFTERLTFPDNALEHLEDCTPLFQFGRIGVIAALAIALIGLLLLALLRGKRYAARSMIICSLLVILAIIGLAVWAVTDFNSLFTAFHQVLFSQGNWTFSPDSLLIQLFPESFWLAMAILWGIVSVVASLFVFVLGLILR